MSDAYVPGVCNIGPAEIRRRRTGGVAGTVAAGVVLGACLVTGAPRPVRTLVALPAAIGAAGFLQAAAHFCSGFGLRGLFDLGEAAGSVEAEADRAEDRRRALGIAGAAGGIGASAAVLALALP